MFTGSEGPNRKKKRRSQSNNKRQRSLSPLSKRMAMLGDSDAGSRTHNSQFNHPYGYQPPPPPVEEPATAPMKSQADIDYELKVSINLCNIFLANSVCFSIFYRFPAFCKIGTKILLDVTKFCKTLNLILFICCFFITHTTRLMHTPRLKPEGRRPHII